jgi:tetratricopeptide (TPR) repeat protein
VDGLDARLARLLGSGDADERYDLGYDLAEAGRPADARRCFEEAAANGWAVAPFGLGNVLRTLGLLDEALDAFTAAVEGGEEDARLDLGLVLLDVERWAEALPVLEVALAGGDRGAQAPIGTALWALGDLAGALCAFRAAEAVGDLEGALQLAFLLRELGERDEAERVAARAAEAGHLTAVGVVACWRWDRTRDPALEEALREGADHYESACADLADLLRTTGRVDEAREVLETGAAKGEVGSWLPLGNLYPDELGDPEAAEAAYRSGIAAGDDHSDHNLAGLLLERGNLDGAEFHLRLGAAGGDALAATALRRLLEED